jgi:hypothetical protein
MTASELIEELKKYPPDSKINIHVDGETNELQLDKAWAEYIAEDKLILLTMSASNIRFLHEEKE